MMIRLKRDLTLPKTKKVYNYGVELKTTDGEGKKVYFVHYYGNTIAFPGDACEEVFMKGEQK